MILDRIPTRILKRSMKKRIMTHITTMSARMGHASLRLVRAATMGRLP